MALVKKLAFYLFIVVAVGLAVWGYLRLRNSKKPGIDAISLLPDSCMVYLSTNNFPELDKRLNSRNLVVDKLKLFSDVKGICDGLALFDSLFLSQPLLQEELSGMRIHLGVYNANSNWLAVLNVSELGLQDQVRNKLAEVLAAHLLKEDVYGFKLRGSSEFYFSLTSGVLAISNSQRLLKRTQDRGRRLVDNPDFIEFRRSGEDNGLLSIYVDHHNYIGNALSSRLQLSAICRQGFSAGVIELQPSEVKVNGFLRPGRSDVVHALLNEEAQTTSFVGMLPLTTTCFKAFGFDNFYNLHARVDSGRHTSAASNVFWKSVNDSALYNVQKELYETISGHFLTFETNSSQDYVMAEVMDTLRAAEQLKYMSDTVLNLDGQVAWQLGHQKDREGVALFEPLCETPLCYATLYRSQLFFTRRKADLEQLITYLKNDMVLAKDKSFAAYMQQNLPDRFNFLVYASPNQNRRSIQAFFNFRSDSKKDPFENFRHFSFSLRGVNGQFRFRWHLLNESEQATEGGNTLWTLKLDTTCSQSPGLFVNHLSGENELLVQDDGNRLYLVNAKGGILWKLPLGEKVQSPFFMVDMYRNNKHQVLFSTRSQLHLIDRNGNYVSGYPVKLPAEASSPLNVLDYDGDKDYRLFIACRNNTIYNYNISGKRQEGFVAVHTDSEVNLPVAYAHVGLSDYLVALDKEGKIYTFSRRGEGRIGLRNKAVANCAAFYVDVTGNINSTYLVYADDKNALIHKISFADKKEIVKLNFEVENADIAFARVDDNSTMDVLFTRLNKIMAYDMNGNLLLKKTLNGDMSHSAVYRDQSHFSLLGFSQLTNELVTMDLIRQRSRTLGATAMPLVCELFNDGKKYLLIPNRATLNCAALD